MSHLQHIMHDSSCGSDQWLVLRCRRLLHRTRQPRERALLTGSTVGGEASLLGLPFIDALYGSQGVLAAVGAILVSVLAGEARRQACLAYHVAAPVLISCVPTVCKMF